MSGRKEHAEGTDRSDFLCVPPADSLLLLTEHQSMAISSRSLSERCRRLTGPGYSLHCPWGQWQQDARLGPSPGSSFCTRSDSEGQAGPILTASASQPARGVTLRNTGLRRFFTVFDPNSIFRFYFFLIYQTTACRSSPTAQQVALSQGPGDRSSPFRAPPSATGAPAASELLA